MHIVKLVYIAHGWVLGFLGKPLIAQQVEAWKYGPVVPEVYRQYSAFGGFPILMPAASQPLQIDDYERHILGTVEKAYRPRTALQLSALTHQAGSPWDITVKRHGLVNAVIPNSLIRDHYKQRIAAN